MLKIYLFKFLTHPLGRLLAAVGLLALSVPVGAFGLKTLHRPGPVSDTASHGTPLNGYTSHAEFEKECSHCHAPLHCITANRCQECHLEIAKQRSEAIGLHGVLPGTARCQTCHIEHQGRDAVISQVPLANIDHGQLAGFSLVLHTENRSGGPFVCDNCHVAHEFASSSVDCIDCHAGNDPDLMAQHQIDYGDRCLDCHDGRDRMGTFDHNQLYPLDGRHAEIACRDCHTGQVYVATPANCADCHPEPDLHAGEFGLQCGWCHSAVAWAPAQFRQHTFLAALGPEGDLPCQVCHVDSYTRYPCDACHGRDEMRKIHQALDIAAVDDCTSCHPTGPGEVRGEARQKAPLRLEAQPPQRKKGPQGNSENPGREPAGSPGVGQGPNQGPAQGGGTRGSGE
jgi:hypothetical protein